MRDFLFKAKSLDGNNIVIGYYQKRYDENEKEQHLIFWAKSYHVWSYVEVDPETICQYTGMKDKHDNMIWENSIVKYNHKGIKVSSYRVVFDEEEGSWMLESPNGARCHCIGTANSKEYQVIGDCLIMPNLWKPQID